MEILKNTLNSWLYPELAHIYSFWRGCLSILPTFLHPSCENPNDVNVFFKIFVPKCYKRVSYFQPLKDVLRSWGRVQHTHCLISAGVDVPDPPVLTAPLKMNKPTFQRHFDSIWQWTESTCHVDDGFLCGLQNNNKWGYNMGTMLRALQGLILSCI